MIHITNEEINEIERRGQLDDVGKRIVTRLRYQQELVLQVSGEAQIYRRERNDAQAQLEVATKALESVPWQHHHYCPVEMGDPVGNCTCHVIKVRAALDKLKGRSS